MSYLTSSDDYDAIVVHQEIGHIWAEWGGFIAWEAAIPKRPLELIAILALFQLRELGHLPEEIVIDEDGDVYKHDDRSWEEWGVVALEKLQELRYAPEAIFFEKDGIEQGIKTKNLLSK